MYQEGDRLLNDFISEFIRKNDKILEVGAGSCAFLEKLIRKYSIIAYGVDPYGFNLEKKNIKCFSLEGEKINSIGEQFNIIFAVRSFHHITDTDKFFKAVYDSLSPFGKLIIVDWKKGTDTGIPEHYYSLDEMRKFCKKYSFSIVKSIELQYNFGIVLGKEGI